MSTQRAPGPGAPSTVRFLAKKAFENFQKSVQKYAKKGPRKCEKTLQNIDQKVLKKCKKSSEKCGKFVRKITKKCPKNVQKKVGRACIKSPFGDVGSPRSGRQKNPRKCGKFVRKSTKKSPKNHEKNTHKPTEKFPKIKKKMLKKYENYGYKNVQFLAKK